MGLWTAIDDPLVVLLDHSDSSGKISPDDCALIAQRLREIAELLPEHGTGHLPSVRAAAYRFAEGCEHANNENEPLVFG